jgi:hypothetical protein
VLASGKAPGRDGIPIEVIRSEKDLLRWLGHTKKMEDGCISKDLVYDELQMGKRSLGRPLLQNRYRDVRKQDILDTNTDLITWEQDTIDHIAWRSKIKNRIVVKEKMI